jgi:WD40 repeat protein
MFGRVWATSLLLLALAFYSIANLRCDRAPRRPFARSELTGTIILGTGNGILRLKAGSTEDYPIFIFRGSCTNHPTWDSLRRRIIFSWWNVSGEQGRRLYSISEKGQELSPVLGGPDDAFDYPSVSWDGTRLAFLSHSPECSKTYFRAPSGKLMLLDLREMKPLSLPPVTVLSNRPVWSPDSRKVMFTSLDSLIMVLDIATLKTDTLWRGNWPSWSPDGRWVAYYRGGRPWLADIQTSEVRPLIPRVILRRSRGGPVHTFLYNFDEHELVWSPDSKYVLCTARAFYDIMGTGTDYMIVRISDGATIRRTRENWVTAGACWF